MYSFAIFLSLIKNEIINPNTIENDNKIKEFLKTTWVYDRIRKEKFKDVFPEWRDMIYYG